MIKVGGLIKDMAFHGGISKDRAINDRAAIDRAIVTIKLPCGNIQVEILLEGRILTHQIVRFDNRPSGDADIPWSYVLENEVHIEHVPVIEVKPLRAAIWAETARTGGRTSGRASGQAARRVDRRTGGQADLPWARCNLDSLDAARE